MNAMFELRNNTSQKNDTYDKNQNDDVKDYIQIDVEEPIVKTEITDTLKTRPKSEEEGEKCAKDDIDSEDTKSIGSNESVKDETDARRRRKYSSSSFIELSEGAVAEILDDVKDQKQSNSYAAKKTVAQGMMDIALITANANQLRYIIEFNRNSSTFYLNITLIVVSLLLQVGVGISLIFKGRMDLRGESKHENAKRINNYVVVGVFLVTIINVFIASFTITGNNGSH